MPVIRLLNAEYRNIKDPSTFEIPSREERENVAVGERVKLLFSAGGVVSERMGVTVIERMWVTVMQNDEDNYTGTLANDPQFTTGLKFGDPIYFSPHHICAIDRSY